MKVKPSLLNIAIRSLAQSMNVHTMEHLVHRLLPNYDLNKRTGFPHSISIPNLDAARQIIYDINESVLFLHTVYRTRGETGTIISDSINSLYHLGQKFAKPGDLLITEEMERFIPSGIQDLFVNAGIYEGRFVFKFVL